MLEWAAPGETTRGMLSGPAGSLQAEITAPEAAARGIAIICHPHPQFGGSKDNKVVYTLARACRQAGLVAIRFNFRGVGQSTGEYAEGEGETEDALAVARWALEQSANQTLLWAGFSFGAAVALRAAVQIQPLALTTIALPTRYFEANMPRPNCPWLAVQGDADDVVDSDAALTCLQGLKPPPNIEVLAGAGHFFHGRLTDLSQVVDGYLAQWLDASDTGSSA